MWNYDYSRLRNLYSTPLIADKREEDNELNGGSDDFGAEV